MEVRHPDGTIIVMETYVQHVVGIKTYRVRYIIDCNDNRVEYQYAQPVNGNDAHLEKIIYPNGIVETWTWSYGQTGFQAPLDTITVSYAMVDGSPPQDLLDAGWVMQFKPISGTRTSADRPFAGEYLWRIYYPKSDYIQDVPAGSLHSLSVLKAYTVLEFAYTPFSATVVIDQSHSTLFNTLLITGIKQFRATSVSDGVAPADAVTTAAISYETAFPFRVHEQNQVLHGSKRRFEYFTNVNTGFVYKTVETLDPDFTAKRITSTAYDANNVMDPLYRPQQLIIESGFKPRTNDPQKSAIDSNGNFKDDIAAQVWKYTYGSCNCSLPSTVTDPLGRVSSYTYDVETGAVLTATVPNPAGNLVGQPSQITFNYNYISPPNQPAGWAPRFLESVTKTVNSSTTTVVSHAYEWQQRLTNVWTTDGGGDRVTDYGYAPRKITTSSPQVTLSGGGTQTISSFVQCDTNQPPAAGKN